MFDAGSHVLRLNPLNQRYCHAAGECWVFAHIFEVSSAERCSLDVDAGSQYNIFSPTSGLLTQYFSKSLCQFRVPCGTQTGVAGEPADKIRCIVHGIPDVIFKFLPHAAGTVGHFEGRDAKSLHCPCAEQSGSVDNLYFFF